MIEWPSVHASAPHPPLHLPLPPPLAYYNIHPAGYAAAAAAHAYEPDVQLGAGLAADRGTPRSLPNSTDRRAPYGDGDGDGDGDGGH